MIPEQTALKIMLSPGTEAERQAKLTALAQDVFHPACPACGSRVQHEDNGATKNCDLSFLCLACGEQWDAVSP